MRPRTLPPLWQVELSDRDAAVIAGYLMRQREGTLNAADTTAQMAAIAPEDVGNFGAEYYRAAEAYNRWLLYGLGYRVYKDSTQWDFVG